MLHQSKESLPQPPDDRAPRQVVLMKKGQQYVFSYQRGEETQLLNHLAELAGDSGSELDWFDVAILSHQVGQCMGDHLRNMKKTITAIANRRRGQPRRRSSAIPTRTFIAGGVSMSKSTSIFWKAGTIFIIMNVTKADPNRIRAIR